MVMPAKPINLQIFKENTAKMSKTDIEKRKKAEEALKVAKNRLKPPWWLGDIAAREFRYIVKETKDIDLLTNLDVHTLALYCNVYQQYVLMTERIAQDGIMVDANKSSETVIASHPLFIRQHQLMDQMRKLQGDLGLTPSSRARMALMKAEYSQPLDPVEGRFGI